MKIIYIILGMILFCIYSVNANNLSVGVNSSTNIRLSCNGNNATALISIYSGYSMIPNNLVQSLTSMTKTSPTEFVYNTIFLQQGTYTAFETCNFNGVTQYQNTIIDVTEQKMIQNSIYSYYNKEFISNNYKIYFRNNTNLDQPVRFENAGYYFIYDISQGELTWNGRPGQPAATTTLGGGVSSNSLDTIINITDKTVNYVNAYSNTTVQYVLYDDMVKEFFILYGLPSFKDYIYLQYSGNIKFNNTLKICTDIQCFIPSGNQDDFETSNKIYFRDVNNVTRFYLSAPIIRDSANHTINGLYSVHGSNAQMNFWLRINTTWLQNATFPIIIDPTIELPSGEIVEMVPNIVPTNVTAASGTPIIVNTTLMLGNNTPLIDAECELDIIHNADGDRVVNFRSLLNMWDGTYTYVWNNPEVGDYTVVEYCWRGAVLDLTKVYGNTSIHVT